jgi:hypothetical protein
MNKSSKNPLSWDTWYRDVQGRMKQYFSVSLTDKHATAAKKLWRQGTSVEEATGSLLLIN